MSFGYGSKTSENFIFKIKYIKMIVKASERNNSLHPELIKKIEDNVLLYSANDEKELEREIKESDVMIDSICAVVLEYAKDTSLKIEIVKNSEKNMRVFFYSGRKKIDRGLSIFINVSMYSKERNITLETALLKKDGRGVFSVCYDESMDYEDVLCFENDVNEIYEEIMRVRKILDEKNEKNEKNEE